MNYHPYYSMYNPNRFRSYPDIDLTIFDQSIQQSKILANESLIILKEFSNKIFAYQVMLAAQNGNQQEVDRLLNSLGISSMISTKYTPTGISIELYPKSNESSYCFMNLYLKWS